MTLTRLVEFDDDRSTYLKTIVEKTDEFDDMESYFNRLGGDIDTADFVARHIKGDETRGVSVVYESTTDQGDTLKLDFNIMVSNNSIKDINGTLQVKTD